MPSSGCRMRRRSRRHTKRLMRMSPYVRQRRPEQRRQKPQRQADRRRRCSRRSPAGRPTPPAVRREPGPRRSPAKRATSAILAQKTCRFEVGREIGCCQQDAADEDERQPDHDDACARRIAARCASHDSGVVRVSSNVARSAAMAQPPPPTRPPTWAKATMVRNARDSNRAPSTSPPSRQQTVTCHGQPHLVNSIMR